MKENRKRNGKKIAAVSLAGLLAVSVTACSGREAPGKNLATTEAVNKKVVNLFGPMEKSNPNADNVARSAFDRTISMAEEKLGVRVDYRTYTAENYQEKTIWMTFIC